jgi:hypothetical protein
MVIIGGTLAGIAATGYGAIAEGIGAGLLIIGAAASGYQIGSGLMKLYEFWGQTRCDTARDSNDLDHAGQTFASGLGETGVGGLQLGLSLLGAKAMETPSLKTTPMLEAYQGEDQLGNPIWNGRVVNYLGDAERQFYKIEIRDGLLYDSEGKLFDTTSASTAHSGDGKAIYIMDQEGNLYASKAQVVGEFHHSSLAGGKPVAGAGEVEVHNGVLTSITDRSGHYQPPAEYTDQVIETLNSKGVDTDSVKVTKLGK